MVAFIVLVVMIASVIKTAIGGTRSRRRNRDEALHAPDTAENARLREEVKQLKERIQVLERITVEKENSLERQIEALRDR